MMILQEANASNLCPRQKVEAGDHKNPDEMKDDNRDINSLNNCYDGQGLRKCEWKSGKPKRSISSTSYPSTDCFDETQENTSAASSSSREEDPYKSQDASDRVIPQIVSFESPLRKRDSSLHKSGPDTCLTDVDFDTDTSRDSTDSFTFPPLVKLNEHKPVTTQQSHCENEVDSATRRKPECVKTLGCSKTASIANDNRTAWKTFTKFRLQYLTVHAAIMLADGLQGTHLYVLYEGYGYSVSTLYSLGFVSGALTSPFIGPIVDKIGRKKAAMIYCLLEIMINYFEQFPLFVGLLASRILGGVTTNLLFTVFESWLVTEHRKRGFEEEKLEIILRDSTIVSNSAAIVSGYLAHCLAENFGPVGPFEGAVAFTAAALVIVGMMWSENYGTASKTDQLVTFRGNMIGAYRTIVQSSHITKIGIIQGLTEGTLQTFVFLWAPALRAFASSAPEGSWGLDKDHEPAYGLIFGSFMAFGVIGGFLEPTIRKAMNSVLSLDPFHADAKSGEKSHGDVNPVSVHILCALCYFVSSILLLTPRIVSRENSCAFSLTFGAFIVYELMIGLYMPCEGVVRSIYMPNESICSLMTMLRVIVNVAVALGVISTNFIPFTYAFGVLSMMMVTSACLQLSLIPRDELKSIFHLNKDLQEKKNK